MKSLPNHDVEPSYMNGLRAAVMGGLLVANAAWAQGDVLVLGGPPPVPVVQPVTYTEPVVYQQPTTIVVQGPVVIQQLVEGYPQPAQACYPPAATVIYVAGPGGCAQDYCAPRGCQTPNVIYFGRGQAYSQGYNFSHRR
jgi:hypothetical protein